MHNAYDGEWYGHSAAVDLHRTHTGEDGQHARDDKFFDKVTAGDRAVDIPGAVKQDSKALHKVFVPFLIVEAVYISAVKLFCGYLLLIHTYGAKTRVQHH